MVERQARPRGLRGLPPPPAGPGAARAGGGQRVLGPRLPDPGPRTQGADRLLLARAGARGRALRPPAPRALRGRPARHPRAPRRPCRERRRGEQPRRRGQRPPRRRAAQAGLDSRPRLRDRARTAPPAAPACARATWRWCASRRPVEPRAPQEIAGLYVLVDSSASRALGYAAQVRRIGELIAGLRAGAGGAAPVGVAAFDQEVAPIFEGPASGFGDGGAPAPHRPPAAGRLRPRRRARLARRPAPGNGRKYPRVLLVTDGVATAGETEARALKAAVHALGAAGVERLDVLAVGGLRDEAVLRELTTGNLAHDGQRIDGAAPPRRDRPPADPRLPLRHRGGGRRRRPGSGPRPWTACSPATRRWSTPTCRRTARCASRSTAGASPSAGEPASAERPLLERAWAQARIERLLHLRETAPDGDEDLRRALGLQIIELSVKHRVLWPVHRPAGAGDRVGLRALRPRPPRARRHPDRRPGRAGRARPHAGPTRPASAGDARRRLAKQRPEPSLDSLGYVAADGRRTRRRPRSRGAGGSRPESKAAVEGGVAAAYPAVCPAEWPAARSAGTAPASAPLPGVRIPQPVAAPELAAAALPRRPRPRGRRASTRSGRGGADRRRAGRRRRPQGRTRPQTAGRAVHRPLRRGDESTWPPAATARPAPSPRPGAPRRRATCWPWWRWARPGRPPANRPRRPAPTAR